MYKEQRNPSQQNLVVSRGNPFKMDHPKDHSVFGCIYVTNKWENYSIRVPYASHSQDLNTKLSYFKTSDASYQSQMFHEYEDGPQNDWEEEHYFLPKNHVNPCGFICVTGWIPSCAHVQPGEVGVIKDYRL